MKGHQFVIFISIFLTLYIAGNFYVFIRGWQALPKEGYARVIYSLIFGFMAFSFIAGEISEKSHLLPDNRFLILAGSLWLAFLLYSFLMVVMIDIVRGLDFFFKFLPSKDIMLAEGIPLKLLTGVISLSLLIVTAGVYTASDTVVKTIDLKINKRAGLEDSLNIVMASDIHLGNIMGRKKLQYLVDTINSLDPDIVLFPGDFFDENPGPVVKDNMGGLIESIKVKYGMYAVTGNHEYIGGIFETVNFLEKHKIRVLRDEAVEINGSFILAGREDKSISRFTDTKRKTLEEILQGKNTKLPLILMDHQPSSVDDSVKNGVDLHLSGHTHNGQLWPVNYITGAIFKAAIGLSKTGETSIFVSKGYGTWGPPVRTTGRPEIIVFQIRFLQ
jgi:predicted MPP superfamily phosphohydrolase